MSSFISGLGKQRVKIMARKTNNELSALPGFFFHPQDTTGLEELKREDRVELLTNQGNYMVDFYKDSGSWTEEISSMLENSRIPTHRRPGVPIPKYAAVPFDLRGVIEVK